MNYSCSGLLGIRAALQSNVALPPPPFNATFNIITGVNTVLMGKIKDLKHKGLDISKSHLLTSANKISQPCSTGTLSHETPTKLKIFLELGLNFGRPGCESLRELEHKQIVFKQDANE